MKQRYCLGFAFNAAGDRVLLIRKNRPAWQAGRLNGIGGKLEPGESALQAMVRECREETGLVIDHWTPFARMSGPDFEVVCFRAITDAIAEALSLTDERVQVHPVDLNLFFEQGNPNIASLIACALRPDNSRLRISSAGDQGLR